MPRFTALLLVLLCAAGVRAEWVAWGAETYTLEAGESVQFHVSFEQIPVRAWRLTVEGGQRLCDVNVLRMSNRSLLYARSDEGLHRVDVPWGEGESIAVTISADLNAGGVFTVKILGPSADSARRAYGFTVNRALEAMDDGENERAESLLNDALKRGEDEGVAALLLAALMKQAGRLEQAAGMLERALRHDLPPDLEPVERTLSQQLSRRRQNLPEALRTADALLAAEQWDAARSAVSLWFAETPLATRNDWQESEAHRRLGRAQHGGGQLYPALESFQLALRAAENPGQRALAHFQLALLQRDLGNADQFRAALEAARRDGLPPDLDARAASLLASLNPED